LFYQVKVFVLSSHSLCSIKSQSLFYLVTVVVLSSHSLCSIKSQSVFYLVTVFVLLSQSVFYQVTVCVLSSHSLCSIKSVFVPSSTQCPIKRDFVSGRQQIWQVIWHTLNLICYLADITSGQLSGRHKVWLNIWQTLNVVCHLKAINLTCYLADKLDTLLLYQNNCRNNWKQIKDTHNGLCDIYTDCTDKHLHTESVHIHIQRVCIDIDIHTHSIYREGYR